ncbi:MAG: hypothetical protein HQK56_21220 [Deltaproteobacteria bacterium]|nr:hypothetical protein [Deltaproteobacteria bacterium]
MKDFLSSLPMSAETWKALALFLFSATLLLFNVACKYWALRAKMDKKVSDMADDVEISSKISKLIALELGIPTHKIEEAFSTKDTTIENLEDALALLRKNKD